MKNLSLTTVVVVAFLASLLAPKNGGAGESAPSFGLISEHPWSVVTSRSLGKAGEVQTDFVYGDPTPAEQGHLEAVNRARMDPLGEAARFGFDLFEGVPAGSISGDPVQPLTFNAQLRQAAIAHSVDMLTRQYFAHVDPDGLDPGDRIFAQGYQFVTAGENLAVRGSSAPIDEYGTVIVMHADLFIDTGIENRGHRLNILNENFKEVGIGIAFGPFDFNGKVLPNSYMLTAEFAASGVDSRSFVLGVVIDDQDSDGFYSNGEGVGGVEIAIIEAGVKTATASAGGYGIPVSPGTYTVEARHADGRTATRTVTVGGANEKVDFFLDEFVPAGGVPVASVFANGSADTVSVAAGNAVTLGIGLDLGGSSGLSGDWFLVQVSPTGVYSFDLASFSFESGLFPMFSAPLFGFGPVNLFDLNLPPGQHYLCFAVDRDGNGMLDWATLSVGCVGIAVSP